MKCVVAFLGANVAFMQFWLNLSMSRLITKSSTTFSSAVLNFQVYRPVWISASGLWSRSWSRPYSFSLNTIIGFYQQT